MNNTEYKIEKVENQTDIIQFLDDRIYDFNSSAINQHDGELFTKVIRNEDGKIIAGISGWKWATISEITLLWVEEGKRKNGLGLNLLQAVEEELMKEGCKTILLRSYSFQAPFFYERNGYKIVYVLDDFPKKYKHYTLVKRIT
ncbi:MAG: GNAT family N-acetyltransferase [Bacteroidetes bacterium]|nr:GNAT family N-acetyltransferase [Bacteroidota bacterium]